MSDNDTVNTVYASTGTSLAADANSSWAKAKKLVEQIPDLDLRREAMRTVNEGNNLSRSVKVFHGLYNLPIVRPSDAHLDFSHISKDRLAMRFGLVAEEFMELCEAMDVRADINFYYLDENGEYVKAEDPEVIESDQGDKMPIATYYIEQTYFLKLLDHDKVSDKEIHQIVRGRLQQAIMETDERDIVDVADACGDLKYVIQGFELEVGIPSDPVLAEIQCSNLSKLGEDGKPIYRNDGKVLKGPNYFKADIYGVLRAHGLRITSASETRI